MPKPQRYMHTIYTSTQNSRHKVALCFARITWHSSLGSQFQSLPRPVKLTPTLIDHLGQRYTEYLYITDTLQVQALHMEKLFHDDT